ncbi:MULTISPECIES: metallophosphoesterase family protein [Bacillaceae]|uniref:Phosphoesterase n=1 Tax=Evansella alkalicola TaxID=745819 RepID=A0ABS6JXL0_9BACI|nr:MULTISPECIES: metallophosphoesterase [Bacillaceae]MBU9721962.1 metallophosphoesterase [Bacillus alkalicola]
MRALILSDSHGWTKEVQQVVQRHQKEVDVIFHCGDSELRETAPELENVISVKGNCDFGDFPEEMTKEVKGTRFFVGHGHLLNVKMTEINLIYKGEEVQADVVCFGHTHVPVAMKEKGIVILNPGSMRLPREVNVGTYVILEDDSEKTDVTFYSIDGKPVETLNKTFFK